MTSAGDYCCARCGRDHRPPPPPPTPVLVTHIPIFGRVSYGEISPGEGEVPLGTSDAKYQREVVSHYAREMAACAAFVPPRWRRSARRPQAREPVRRLGPVCM